MRDNVKYDKLIWKLEGCVDITGMSYFDIMHHVIPYLVKENKIKRHNELNYFTLEPFSMTLGKAKKTFIQRERIFINHLWGDALSIRMHNTHKYCKVFRTKESLDN